MSSEEATAPEGQTAEPEVQQNEKSVSYETHRKLLGEKKSIQERYQQAASKASELEALIKSQETKALEEQNQYKQLYEQLKTENTGLKGAIEERDKTLEEALKIDAFTKALGNRKIPSKYMGFIGVDNIVIDPETSRVDELSAQKEVERILAEYPEIIRGAVDAKPVPAQAPQPAASSSKNEQYELLQRYAKMKLGR